MMPLQKKYYLHESHDAAVPDGTIGIIHQQQFLAEGGYIPLTLETGSKLFVADKLKRILRALSIFSSFRPGSVLVVQFPIYSYLHRILLKILLLKKARIICITIDIDGIRDENEALYKNELKLLATFRQFIFNNERMQNLLSPHLRIEQYSCFQLLDYHHSFVAPVRKKDATVVFAGSLKKGRFIEALANGKCAAGNFKLHVYGKNSLCLKDCEQVIYKGSYPPESILEKLEGSFGLVWDGTSIETCGGGNGKYLRYNSPQKLSLYILAGLPVLIWDQAAAAALVRELHIGITIGSLLEIEEKISSIDEEAYRQMQLNMLRVAADLKKGSYIKEALKALI